MWLKKMDSLSLLGLCVGILAIVLGNMAEGGSIWVLFNLPAAVIVIGGTFGAALLQTPKNNLSPALHMLRWILFPPENSYKENQEKIINWATMARREGLLGLENIIEYEKNTFAKKGLEMLVDGYEPLIIRDALNNDRLLTEMRAIDAAKVYEAMGGYAPTIGILGAVLGLIQVMSHLSDPSQLGSGIAVAFVATIYGVGFANLILLPVANKLKALVIENSIQQDMFIEGVVGIAEGENPRSIALKISGYQHDQFTR